MPCQGEKSGRWDALAVLAAGAGGGCRAQCPAVCPGGLGDMSWMGKEAPWGMFGNPPRSPLPPHIPLFPLYYI